MFRDGNGGKVAHLKLSKCCISWAYCELCSNSPLYFSETHENIILQSLPSASAKRFIFIYYSLSKVILLITVDVKSYIKHLNHLHLRNKLAQINLFRETIQTP